MVIIANLKIEPPLILAPMTGITDLPFRRLMRRFGAPLAFMEMVNVRSLPYNTKKSHTIISSEKEDRPLGIQLLGSEEKFILRGLEIIQRFGIDLVDFNAACPVKKVVRRGEGAALLKEPKKLFKLLKLIKKNTRLPVTLKIRTGWDKNSLNSPEIAKSAQDAGVSCIFIHGRTREQFYGGDVDYKTIKKVKHSVQIPVIASGNIFSAILAKKMLDETGCDGLLLARGTLGNPWLFKEIKSFLKTRAVLKPPRLNLKIKIMYDHLNDMISFYGEKRGVVLFRKFLGLYLKGNENIRQVRNLSSTLKTKKELSRLLAGYFSIPKTEQKIIKAKLKEGGLC